MTIPVPAPLLSKPSGFKAILKRALAGFLTVVTSGAAVKEEKNIAVLVVTGVLLSVGASAGLVSLVTSIVQGL